MKNIAFLHLNKLLCLLLCAISLGLLFTGVCAQPEEGCRLVIEYGHESSAIPKATFRLYRVADITSDGKLSYIGAFSDLRLDAEALRHGVQDLYARVEDQSLEPERTLVTDREGMASANDLTPGAFLLVGEPTAYNGFVYYVDNQVIFLKEDTLTLRPKSTRLPADMKLIAIKAVKRWEDRGYENERPKAIVVRLMKDGQTYSSVVLSDANDWSYSWSGLLPNARWTVEEDVPEGYTVSVQESDHVFTLTNHRKDIPQTGHIWWPVITVLCVGLALIALGVKLRRSGHHEA